MPLRSSSQSPRYAGKRSSPRTWGPIQNSSTHPSTEPGQLQCEKSLEMVLDHRIEWRGGGPARAVDVLGARPAGCIGRRVSVAGDALGRGRHRGAVELAHVVAIGLHEATKQILLRLRDR
jgi:hypothetical protein